MQYFLVDAFATRPYEGNPAAVVPLDAWRPDDWLQAVAREMNQSETAFLVAAGDGFELRWLTPCVEVDLCGHATLASAFVIWREGWVPAGSAIRFSTRSGVLTAHQVGDWMELDFPLQPATQCPAPAGLLESLGGVIACFVGHNGTDYLVEVESEDQLRALQPDFGRLRQLQGRGVMVTARATKPPYDFVSRFFAPASGIPEDPVTGSAHCCLADYWRTQLGKSEFVAFQASPRGGALRVRIVGDRVRLGGQAVLVARGQWLA
jgi:predicted PhzF superfamily epimerase YddE/YHI9